MSQKESEWEQEFDTVFAYDDEYGFYRVSEGSHVDAGEMKLFISKAIATAVANREKEIAEEVKKKVGLMRQWLNEDRITDNNKMVTSEELLHWLKH